MNQMKFKLIGHKCPLDYYPSTVLPILQDGNNLYIAYLAFVETPAKLVSINDYDVYFIKHDAKLRSSELLKNFDYGQDRLFAFAKNNVVSYRIVDQSEFFINILKDNELSKDNPFLRLSLAELTNNSSQIKKEVILCGQKVLEETPEFYNSWYQQQEEQLKEDFPQIWKEIFPIAIPSLQKQHITITEKISPSLESASKETMNISSSNCEFDRYSKKDLSLNHLVPQSLDNQWIPRTLIYKMKNDNLSFEHIQNQVEQDKRMEFRRALINSKQIVINRAAIYNETAVSECFYQPGENREAFKTFLNNGDIIPFLFSEDSPIQAPEFTTSAFEAWKQVCQEVKMKCVRLSWQEENKSIIREQIARKFHEFCKSTRSGDIEIYLGALNLPVDQREHFKKSLSDLRNKCNEIEDEDKLITREQLYEAFVTADGTKPVERKYDFTKPFAAEIKQLIDLKYNVNLPDVLGGIVLTPYDSLPRSALQEIYQYNKNTEEKKGNAEDWLKLLKDSAFERLQQGIYLESLLQDGYLDSLASLNLQEVLEVRQTEEWAIYMKNMDDLLNHPEQFEAKAEPVYKSYIELNKQMTNLVKSKRSEKIEIWTPSIEYILEIAGAQLNVKWSEQGITYAFSGEVPASESIAEVRYFEKFRIAGSQDNQADLNMTIELNKGITSSPIEQWKDLKGKIPEIPGFKPVKSEPILVGNDATINRTEN
jgi:hypothetical protein